MTQWTFGSGSFWAARQDVANSTPQQFGTFQELSLDMSFTIKELFGQQQLPVAIGRGTAKITGKAKFAVFSGRLFNDILFGVASTTGLLLIANREAGSIPATPFQVTVANTATFVDDLGVYYAATGVPLTKVASAPITGQYSVSGAGVYTFAAADTLLAVSISYTYTSVGAAPNQRTTIPNMLLGTQPTFAAYFTAKDPTASKNINIKLKQCVTSKFTLQSKLEDFIIPEVDFACFVDAAGNLLDWSSTE